MKALSGILIFIGIIAFLTFFVMFIFSTPLFIRAFRIKKVAKDFGLNYTGRIWFLSSHYRGNIFKYSKNPKPVYNPYKRNTISGKINGKNIKIYDDYSFRSNLPLFGNDIYNTKTYLTHKKTILEIDGKKEIIIGFLRGTASVGKIRKTLDSIKSGQ
jgi:hypothetical protein